MIEYKSVGSGDKALVYLLLGLMPFAGEILPASWRPNIEWRGVPFFAGIFTTIIQFMSGVGGPFLDIFFQKSVLDRKTTLATKAIAQSASVAGRFNAAKSGMLLGMTRMTIAHVPRCVKMLTRKRETRGRL